MRPLIQWRRICVCLGCLYSPNSDEWIPEVEFEESLKHIPRVSPKEVFRKQFVGCCWASWGLRLQELGFRVYVHPNLQAIPFQGAPRSGTLSVALPASIIANCQVSKTEKRNALIIPHANTLRIFGCTYTPAGARCPLLFISTDAHRLGDACACL